MAYWTKCLISATLLVAAGCGGEDRGYLTGTVTLSGAPTGSGTISLEPVSGVGSGAMAFVGEDGKYSVISAGREEGAHVGEYRVKIEGGNRGDFGSEGAAPAPKSNIPARYANYETSDLKVTIESGENEFDIELQP